MVGNVKLPDYGVFEIRTRNTTYKLIRLNGQDQIKGHSKYCPVLTPVQVQQLYLGQPMLLRYPNRDAGRQYVVTSTVFEIGEVVGGSHV